MLEAFLEMTSFPPSWNPTPSFHAYLLQEHSSKFHPDPIWNDGALGFFKEVAPTTRNTQTQEQDE